MTHFGSLQRQKKSFDVARLSPCLGINQWERTVCLRNIITKVENERVQIWIDWLLEN